MAARALSPAQIAEIEALRLRAAHLDERRLAVVSTGLAALDEVLPHGGFVRGAVTELSAADGLASSTTIALSAIATAQREARERGGESALAALIDPSCTVHGPFARALGVDTTRLVVARPSADAAAKTALRVVQSRAFSAVVIDTAGVPGARTSASLSSWVMATRRIALAAEGCDTAVILLTSLEMKRPLPLPVAMRLELREAAKGRLSVRIAKEKQGHVGGWRSIALDEREARSA